MASTSCPDDVLQASDGKTRFFRLARLLLCGGTAVMRELFDSIIPPANLATVLSSPAVLTTLQIMKNKRLLTSPQWQILFPPTGTCVQSTSFDITLLFKLLRENVICGLIPPSTGWDRLPNIGDISLPADLARIKYFRNAIAHGDEKMELTEPEFIDYWKEIKGALVRIVGRYGKSGSSTVTDWETAINKLLTDPLTENDKKNVEELKSWYLDERELKGMVEQLLKRGEGDRKDERELKEMVQQLVQKGEANENDERELKKVVQQLLKKGESGGKVFTIRFASRIATVGGWLGGNIYILNRLKDHPDLLLDYIKYGVIPTGIALVCMAFSSIKLTLRGETLDGLDELWRRYKTGQLKKDFEKVMVTDELKTLANGERNELSVEINEKEFIQTRRYLEKLSPAKYDEREEDSVEEHSTSEEPFQIKQQEQKEDIPQEKIHSFCVLPPKPSHQIIYRSDEAPRVLEEMGRLNNEKANELTVIYLSGNSGCGKSELARQIGEKFFRNITDQTTEVKFVFTLNASNIDTLIQSHVEFAMILGCVKESIRTIVTAKDVSPSKKLFQLKTLVAPKLEMYYSWLLIVDNVSDLELVLRYLPQKGEKTIGNGQLLVTTQDSQAIAPDSHTFHLSLNLGMKYDVAVHTLTEIFACPIDKEITLQIADALSFQPLALACVGAYMRKVHSKDSSITWMECLMELEESQQKVNVNVQQAKTSLTYPDTTRAAVVMAVEKEISDEIRRHAFNFLSVMAPEPISLKYVVEYVARCISKEDKEFVAASIASSPLIYTKKSKEIGVHEVVHDCLQIIIPNDKREDEFVLLSNVVETFLALKYYDFDNCDHTLTTGSLVVHFVILMERLKNYVGHCPSALLERPLSKDYTDMTNCLLLIGDICSTHGKHEAARICFEVCLIIQETVKDKNDPILVSTLSSLGFSHLNQGQHNEARKCFERALAIEEMMCDKNDPALIKTLNNLGETLRDIGLLEEAKRCYERALSIDESSKDKSNQTLAHTLSNLGNVFGDLGNFEEARRCLERALDIYKKSYNESHSTVSFVLNSLGNILRDLGEYGQAKRCFDRVLSIYESAHDENHRGLASTLNNLGNTFRDLGQEEEAKICFERALSIFEIDADAPSMAAVLNNLGVTLRDVGQNQEAKCCLERALAIQEKAYGENHSCLATTLNNLGNTLRDLGQEEEANRLFQRAVAINEIVYDKNHPNLAITLKNLALSFCSLGQYSEAVECFERALSIIERSYGTNAPFLATTLNDLGESFVHLEQFVEATRCFERALAINESVYDKNHPALAATLNNR